MVVPERLRSILGDRDVNVSRSCERRFVAAFISRRAVVKRQHRLASSLECTRSGLL